MNSLNFVKDSDVFFAKVAHGSPFSADIVVLSFHLRGAWPASGDNGLHVPYERIYGRGIKEKRSVLC
jgi:hypothetical protein